MWTWQFAKSLWISHELDLHRFETIQTHYNLCYREEEREMIPFCKDQNISVLSYNPVAKGFLTGKYIRNAKNNSIRFKTDPALAAKFFKSEDFDILEVVIQIANEKDVKPAQIALAWLLEKNITSPIIGVTKKLHVEEAIDSLNIKLTSDDIKRLEEPYQVHSIHHLD
jgi:aryl-alcohol dehydrogenase (NADP+)